MALTTMPAETTTGQEGGTNPTQATANQPHDVVATPPPPTPATIPDSPLQPPAPTLTPPVPNAAVDATAASLTPPPLAQPTAKAPQPSSLAPDENIRSDIARILDEAKLPERRDFKGAADRPTPPPPPPPLGPKDGTILEERITKVGPAGGAKGAVVSPVVDTKPVSAPLVQTMQTAAAKITEPAVAPPPPKEPEQRSIPPEHSSSIVTPLRTLKDDLQSIIRDKKISLVHAVTLEEEKKQKQAAPVSPEQQQIRKKRSRRAINIVFASLVLIGLGTAAIFGVVFIMNQKAAVPAVVPQSSLLFAENTLTFPMQGQSVQTLKSALAQARLKPLGALGSITRIEPTLTATSTSGAAGQQREASLAEFFAALGVHPPDQLMRSVGAQFFFGIHTADTNGPLLIIPVTSYDHAFAGMLEWEASINADLAPAFTAVPATKLDASGLPAARTFQDIVLRNYDTRALEDDSGNVVLYYSFPTPNILVIAESPYSFPEILSRLQAQRKL